MSLDRFDGFDHFRHDQTYQKWVYESSIDQEGPTPPAPFADGLYTDYAWSMMNTGFGRVAWSHDYGYGGGVQRVVFGMHLRVGFSGLGSFSAHSDFFQLRYIGPGLSSPVKHLSFALKPDGAIEIVKGAGTIVGTTAAGTVSSTVYHYFDFEVSTSQVIRIWKDGVKIFEDLATYPFITGTDILAQYSLVGYCWEYFGQSYFVTDNFYLFSGGGDQPLGEIRVSTQFVNRTAPDLLVSNISRVVDPSIATHYTSLPFYGGMLLEQIAYPFSLQTMHDSDATYLTVAPGNTGQGRFQFARFQPVGTILALSVTMAVKGTGTLKPLLKKGSLSHTGSLKAVASPAGYVILQWIYLLDPTAGVSFNEQDFADGVWSFGFEAAASSSALRVTQLVVERIHLAGGGSTAEYSIR